MRIRSIKPEFWRSDDITALENWDDRLIFIGLWSYVDDNGVGLDRLASIAADLFAGDLERDSRETFARVSRGLQNLFEAGRLSRYGVDGKQFLYIINWERHQRIDKPNKARYPLPTLIDTEIFPENARPSRDPRESPATGTEEQRNRGTEEQGIKKTCPAKPRIGPDEFTDWYLEYPRKESKGLAEKAYVKARMIASAEDLAAGAIRYRADPNREPKFTKHPASWLNGKCWEDAPIPDPARQPRTNAEKRLDLGRENHAMFAQLDAAMQGTKGLTA